MKRIIVALFLVFLCSNLFCQSGFFKMKKIPIDTFAIDVFSDYWKNKPSDLKTKFFNPGVNIYATGNILFSKKSKFSFSYGAGISMNNLYANALVKNNANKISYFSKIPDTVTYKKCKLNVLYADVPLELHFKSNPKSNASFNATIGFKIGMLIDAHSKYKGYDTIKGTDDKVKDKQRFVPNLEKVRYGITARIGIGKFYLFGYYSLSTLFLKNEGPDMYPISFGISIIP